MTNDGDQRFVLSRSFFDRISTSFNHLVKIPCSFLLPLLS